MKTRATFPMFLLFQKSIRTRLHHAVRHGCVSHRLTRKWERASALLVGGMVVTAATRGDRARAKAKAEEKRDPRAFNPQKRNSSWVHFERESELSAGHKGPKSIVYCDVREGRGGAITGVASGRVGLEEGGGSRRIRPRDKGMTTVARSNWQSYTFSPFSSFHLSPISCLALFVWLSFSFQLFLFSGWKARTRTRNVGNSNRDGQLYINSE